MNRSEIFFSLLAGTSMLLSGCGSEKSDMNLTAEKLVYKSDAVLNGSGLAVSNDVIYAISGNSSYSKVKGLFCLAVKNNKLIDAPAVLTTNVELPPIFPQSVAVMGNQIYVVDGRNIYKYVCSDSGVISLAAKKLINEDLAFGPAYVTVFGEDLLVAARRGGVWLLDEDLKLKGRLPSSFARSVAHSGNEIAVADDNRGVLIYERSDGWLKKSFKLKQKLDLPRGSAFSVQFSGDLLLVAGGSTPLFIFTKEINGGYRLLSEVKILPGAQFYGSNSYDLAVDQSNVYLAGGESGVVAIDISDAQNPQVTGYVPELFYRGIKNIELLGDKLLVNDDGNELFLLDKSNPRQMQVLDSRPLTINAK